MVNMSDVALHCGLSKATVSRVLNGKSFVSSSTRERVLSSCRALNYRLDHNIQDLILKTRNGYTRNVALVVVGRNFADPVYARRVDALSSIVNDAYYQLSLVKLSGSESCIYDLPPLLRDARVDGILLTGELKESTISLVKSLDCKCVVLGNFCERLLSGLPNVRSNTNIRLASMMETLISEGKKKIAFVAENPDNYETKNLFATYKEILQENKLSFNPDICYFGHGEYSGVFTDLLPVMKEKSLPFDAIVCPDLRLAQELGYLLFGRFGLEKEIDVKVAVMRTSEFSPLPIPIVFSEEQGTFPTKTAFEYLLELISKSSKIKTITV